MVEGRAEVSDYEDDMDWNDDDDPEEEVVKREHQADLRRKREALGHSNPLDPDNPNNEEGDEA